MEWRRIGRLVTPLFLLTTTIYCQQPLPSLCGFACTPMSSICSEFPNWESNAWPGATVTCAAMCANTAAPSSPRVLEGERAQKNDRMTGRRARHGSRYFVGFFYIPVLLDGGRIDGKFLWAVGRNFQANYPQDSRRAAFNK
ncbi:hypothetical protein DFH09DRAFT_1179770 [Mycena vulgaris]|nr:hypothetical protein DFH09DRAFT_1179770 [Mycena vulgaris]